MITNGKTNQGDTKKTTLFYLTHSNPIISPTSYFFPHIFWYLKKTRHKVRRRLRSTGA